MTMQSPNRYSVHAITKSGTNIFNCLLDMPPVGLEKGNVINLGSGRLYRINDVRVTVSTADYSIAVLVDDNPMTPE